MKEITNHPRSLTQWWKKQKQVGCEQHGGHDVPLEPEDPTLPQKNISKNIVPKKLSVTLPLDEKEKPVVEFDVNPDTGEILFYGKSCAIEAIGDTGKTLITQKSDPRYQYPNVKMRVYGPDKPDHFAKLVEAQNKQAEILAELAKNKPA